LAIGYKHDTVAKGKLITTTELAANFNPFPFLFGENAKIVAKPSTLPDDSHKVITIF
jgi:hypothetical protein